MSRLKYGWWSYAKHMIRAYPALKHERDELGRQLPRARQRELEAVEKAIEKTKLLRSGSARLELVSLVLWQGTHNTDGAAVQIHVSQDTARKYHADFIRLVGFCYGLEDMEEGA